MNKWQLTIKTWNLVEQIRSESQNRRRWWVKSSGTEFEISRVPLSLSEAIVRTCFDFLTVCYAIKSHQSIIFADFWGDKNSSWSFMLVTISQIWHAKRPITMKLAVELISRVETETHFRFSRFNGWALASRLWPIFELSSESLDSILDRNWTRREFADSLRLQLNLIYF